MKKILLTASALSMLAGAASAEVTLSGDARFYLDYVGGTTTVRQRVRGFLNMSTETDGGITATARFGFDMRNDGGAATGFNGGTARQVHPLITIASNGFEFALGNTNGAVIDLVGIWAGGLGVDGTVGRGALNAGLDGDENPNQTVRLKYTTGAFTVAASTTTTAGAAAEVAAAYSANGILVAAGASSVGNRWAVKGQYSGGAYTVGLILKDGNEGRLYGSYTTGAWTLGANVSRQAGNQYYGVGASYALGGGVSVVGAVGSNNNVSVAQLGMTMSF